MGTIHLLEFVITKMEYSRALYYKFGCSALMHSFHIIKAAHVRSVLSIIDSCVSKPGWLTEAFASVLTDSLMVQTVVCVSISDWTSSIIFQS